MTGTMTGPGSCPPDKIRRLYSRMGIGPPATVTVDSSCQRDGAGYDEAVELPAQIVAIIQAGQPLD